MSSAAAAAAADQFPKQVGAALAVSPAPSGFSFDEIPPRSPRHIAQHDSLAVDRKDIVRSLEWGAPGEKKDSGAARGVCHSYTSRKAQYFEGQFNERDTTGPARDRVSKDNAIIAELKTNVMINDEYTLVTNLSYQMSQRFMRPEQCIMVSLDHSACLLLAGSFEPAYVLTVTALPSQVQPVTNKRNAAMLQSFLRSALGVPADRGIVRFQAIDEANLATAGRTVLSEVEHEERRRAEENGGLKGAVSKASRRSSLKPKKSLTLSRKTSTRSGRVTTPTITSPGPFDSVAEVPEHDTRDAAPAVQLKPSIRKSTPNLLIPPEEKPLPRLGTRKSFIAIFRR